MKQLIYIASTGYSGSTLLESLLGTNHDCLNLGEVCKIAWSPLCACGEDLDACLFWGAVEERLDRAGNPKGLSARHIDRRRCRGLPGLHEAFIALGTPRNRRLFRGLSRETAAFQDGCERALELYEAAAAVAGASIVVDSSKDPVLLKHLYTLAPEKFRVIHLVRDARAVSWSFVKNFERDGASYPSETSKRRPTVAEAAAYWKNRNRNIRLTTRSIPLSQKILLRYEDLCRSPEEAAERIEELVGVRLRLPSTFQPRTQHSIAGNPMRTTESEIAVQLDEEWRSRLDSERLAEVERVAGGMNRRFGYR